MEDKSANALDILVVDDEAAIRRALQICLQVKGHRVHCVASGSEALAALSEKEYSIVLLDIRLGNESGLDLIVPFRQKFPWVKIIVITAHASVDTAVRAMREGALDYLPKPFSPDQVYEAVDKVRKVADLEGRIETLKPKRSSTSRGNGNGSSDLTLDSGSERMKAVLSLANSIAATDATILIRGESGTGKTMMARRIHDNSHRSSSPFVVVSCPSLSNELLESELFGHAKGSFTGAHKDYQGRVAAAQGGTLFLDEIGEMSPTLQAKMLRFSQDREYESVGEIGTKKADVRIITATNVNLEEHVKAGKFREDLLFRLNVIEIEMIPLRERRADILPIAEKLLAELAQAHHRPAESFSRDASDLLLSYPWPGNIRELRNVVERCVLLAPGPIVQPDLFPTKLLQEPESGSGLSTRTPLPEPSYDSGERPVRSADECKVLPTLDEVEEAHIRKVLAICPSIDDAARTLGVDRATLYRRRKRYGIT